MGMYTELYISAQIKPDAKNLPAFKALFVDRDIKEKHKKFHKLHHAFTCSRIQFGMIPGGCSHYFTPMSSSKCEWNEISQAYCLTFRCDLKNYEGEIEAFLDWLMPMVDGYDGEHIGHKRYEESEAPTLLFKTSAQSQEHFSGQIMK